MSDYYPEPGADYGHEPYGAEADFDPFDAGQVAGLARNEAERAMHAADIEAAAREAMEEGGRLGHELAGQIVRALGVGVDPTDVYAMADEKLRLAQSHGYRPDREMAVAAMVAAAEELDTRRGQPRDEIGVARRFVAYEKLRRLARG